MENTGTSMVKTREQKTERVKIDSAHVELITKAIAFYRDDILSAVPELAANPRFARFAAAIESEASVLASISANLQKAEYVAYSVAV